MRFLVDTDILSEPLRPAPNAGVLAGLERHGGEVATSALNLHELLFGARRLPAGRRRRSLEGYARGVVARTLPVLPYDEKAAAWHADERARLERAGRTVPFTDGQIAAVAAVNELVLVTRSLRDFKPFRGLRVEDWSR